MNLEKELRRHDAAGHITADLSQSPKAHTTFARVTEGAPGVLNSPKRKRRRTRYYLTAAAAAVGVVVAPVLGGGTAFADWTAQARPATAQEAARWGEDCEKWVGEDVDGVRHDLSTKLVEIRGDWSLAYLQAEDGFESLCLSATTPIDDLGNTEGQALSASLNEEPAGDGLVTNSVMQAEFESGDVFIVAGKLGPDVESVTFDADGVDAEATVQDGNFVAWWPERKPASLLERITHNGPPNPDVRITLKDGTSRIQPIQDFDVSPM